MLNINPLAIKDLESVEALTLESKQIVGPSRFFWKASAPNSCICFFFGRGQPQTFAAKLLLFLLEGVSPNLPDRWVHVFGRCQPQTLAARSLGPVFFGGVSPKHLLPDLWVHFLGEVSAPNSCCRISGASLFLEGVSLKLLLPDLWGQLVLWKVSAPNSCCRISGVSFFWKAPNSCSVLNSCCQISGASLCFGRCQPQTLADLSVHVLGEVSAPNSCSPKLLLPDLFFLELLLPHLWGCFFFGRCQPQTLAARSLRLLLF